MDWLGESWNGSPSKARFGGVRQGLVRYGLAWQRYLFSEEEGDVAFNRTSI